MSLNGEEGNGSHVSRGGQKLLGAGLALTLACAAFFSGLHIGENREGTENQVAGLFSLFLPATISDNTANLDEFWRVWNLLDAKFVSSSSTQAVSTDEKIEGAIDGLVGSYDDPYTVFLPPREAEQFEDDISGNFGGVGMEVGIRDDLVTVIAPLRDTPAEKAGIIAGDVVVKIDGESTEGMSIDEAVRSIRGEIGTDVVLTIYRKGELEFKDITVKRDLITVPTLETEVKDDVFVIRLYNFNALAETKMQEALRTFVSERHKKLVLDLRGNPGGFLQSAVAIGSYLLPSGKVIVREHFGEGIDEQVYRSSGKQITNLNPNNFVVLIDGSSASASEILAGALSEHVVATTIGEKTFGKGSVQELVDLPSGASLKITVARWLTPDGVSFSDGGLDPLYKVTRTPQQIIDSVDPQMDAAIEWLKGNRDIGEKGITEAVGTINE